MSWWWSAGRMGCRPCGPRFFGTSGFPFFLPSSLGLVGQDFFRPSGWRGLRSTSDGEKQGFMTSVAGLASQKWGIEGDWPLGIVRVQHKTNAANSSGYVPGYSPNRSNQTDQIRLIVTGPKRPSDSAPFGWPVLIWSGDSYALRERFRLGARDTSRARVSFVNRVIDVEHGHSDRYARDCLQWVASLKDHEIAASPYVRTIARAVPWLLRCMSKRGGKK
jgi:hypothetical protein